MAQIITSIIGHFRTAVPFWGQTRRISSSLSPKRDGGPKRVNQQMICDIIHDLEYISSEWGFMILAKRGTLLYHVLQDPYTALRTDTDIIAVLRTQIYDVYVCDSEYYLLRDPFIARTTEKNDTNDFELNHY